MKCKALRQDEEESLQEDPQTRSHADLQDRAQANHSSRR
jgi:hypothetical protein